MLDHDLIETRYDAVIVGARVAGAATAMLLARAGLRVLALERSVRGSDTTSTHALMRAGVMQLHRWGILERVVAAGTPAIHRTTFHYGDESVVIPIKPRDGVDSLFAPRRTLLDALLADAAVASGARVIHGALVEGVIRARDGAVCGVTFRGSDQVPRHVGAGIVIGADGARSRIARQVHASPLHTGSRAGAYVYGYHRVRADGTHWHFGDGVAAGVIPTNDDLVCVFAGLPAARYATRAGGVDALFHQVLERTDPALAAAVKHAERIGGLHPFGGMPGHVLRSWGPGWALVGDAGCFKDPLTAHGITDALRDAELLANAVRVGTPQALADYQHQRDALAVPFMQLSDRIGSFDWDLASVKELHHQLSEMMASECDVVRAFDGEAARAAAA